MPHTVSQSKHLIIHDEVNFSLPSPPPYKRKIWDYNHANYTCMTKLFFDLFLQIMSLNIPNKIITCNDSDAPWVTSELKTAIK